MKIKKPILYINNFIFLTLSNGGTQLQCYEKKVGT